MAAKKATTKGTAARIATAKKRAALKDKHAGRRKPTVRTVNAVKSW